MTRPGPGHGTHRAARRCPGCSPPSRPPPPCAGILAVQRPTAPSPGSAATTSTRGTTSRRRWRWTRPASTSAPRPRYAWLARHQNADGSWYAAYRTATPDRPTDRGRESNFCAYLAVGVWHHYLATGDDAFLDRMWPTVRAAVEFVLALQQPGGQIGWKREADGTAAPRHRRAADRQFLDPPGAALRARHRRAPRRAAARLGAGGRRARPRDPPAPGAVPGQEPLLDGLVLPGARRRAARARAPRPGSSEGWDRFVVPGLGVRCVAAQPVGDRRRERRTRPGAVGGGRVRPCGARSSRDIQHLRADDGLYWTGYVFDDDAVWPVERTTWTAGALLLAVAALGGDEATTAVFGGGPAAGRAWPRTAVGRTGRAANHRRGCG